MPVTQSQLPSASDVLDANRAAGRTVVVAESCTGGMISVALTDVAGSSDVFVQGFVTYSDESKVSALGVNEEIIATFGAVSQATAWAMVEGALRVSGADVAIAVTGIAGPTGGTDRKPVGTVVFARGLQGESPDAYWVRTVRFTGGDRNTIRRSATQLALALLHPDFDADQISDEEEIAALAG